MLAIFSAFTMPTTLKFAYNAGTMSNGEYFAGKGPLNERVAVPLWLIAIATELKGASVIVQLPYLHIHVHVHVASW